MNCGIEKLLENMFNYALIVNLCKSLLHCSQQFLQSRSRSRENAREKLKLGGVIDGNGERKMAENLIKMRKLCFRQSEKRQSITPRLVETRSDFDHFASRQLKSMYNLYANLDLAVFTAASLLRLNRRNRLLSRTANQIKPVNAFT
jgi:hypothetical protein